MTAQELSSWLRVNRKTVYEYAARNVIPCRRLGRKLVFFRAAIAAWLARSPTAGVPHNPR
jgi:excisionase family DNA binding protein